jgi:hypothetical protein
VEYSRKLITAANFKRHPWQSYEVGSRFNGVPLNLEDNDWKKKIIHIFLGVADRLKSQGRTKEDESRLTRFSYKCKNYPRRLL